MGKSKHAIATVKISTPSPRIDPDQIKEAARLLLELAGWLDSIESQGEHEAARRVFVRALELFNKITQGIAIVGYEIGEPAIGRFVGRDRFKPGFYRNEVLRLGASPPSPLSQPEERAIGRDPKELTDEQAAVWALIDESGKHVGRARYWGSRRGELSDKDAKRKEEVFVEARRRLPVIAEAMGKAIDDLSKADDGSEMKDSDHSEDFHFVRWYGQEHTFTNQQAAIVKLLWQAWEKHTPDLGQDYLLEAAGSSTGRLRNVFKEKDRMHPILFGTGFALRIGMVSAGKDFLEFLHFPLAPGSFLA